MELAARLRALVRRAHGVAEPILEAGALRMVPASREVWLDERIVELSLREYEILQIFMLHTGRVLTRTQIEQHLYQWGTEVSSNTVEVHIYNLRKKLRPDVIETLRGVGYMLPQQIRAEATGKKKVQHESLATRLFAMAPDAELVDGHRLGLGGGVGDDMAQYRTRAQ